MLSARSSELVEKIVQKQIETLANFIATKAEYLSLPLVAAQLALIGTKGSADALANLIKTTPDQDTKEMLAEALLVFSPFREDHRELLGEVFVDEPTKIEEMLNEFKVEFDSILLKSPLWQEIAEALEAEYLRITRESERDALSGTFVESE